MLEGLDDYKMKQQYSSCAKGYFSMSEDSTIYIRK